jgi:hypothetical protein
MRFTQTYETAFWLFTWAFDWVFGEDQNDNDFVSGADEIVGAGRVA